MVFFLFCHQWRRTVSCSQALVLCKQHPAEPWCGSLVPDASIDAGWEVDCRLSWEAEGTCSRTTVLERLFGKQERLFGEEELLEEWITSSRRQEVAVSAWLGAGNIIGGLSWSSKSLGGEELIPWLNKQTVYQNLAKLTAMEKYHSYYYVDLLRWGKKFKNGVNVE